MIRGNHFYVTLISENRCNYRGFYRKSLLLPLAEGSVHTHTHKYLDAFYFIFREIPVNQTAFIFIKSYGIPNHSTRAPGTTGGIMWDTRGHWNMKMKGKKKEKRIETVTMDALPFNGCSLLFFFSLKYRRRRSAPLFRIRMKSVILNVGSKNILQ